MRFLLIAVFWVALALIAAGLALTAWQCDRERLADPDDFYEHADRAMLLVWEPDCGDMALWEAEFGADV